MKSTVFSAAVVALATSAAHAQEAVQWRVEDGGNGHWYQGVLPNPRVTWLEAHQRCTDQGGHLATLTSEDENTFVYQRIASNVQYWYLHPCSCISIGPWIGFRRINGAWGWVTGEPTTFTAWHPGEPFFYPLHDFVRFFHYTGPLTPAPLWDNLTNDDEPTSYIIEWSADCNNDGIVDYGQILSGQLIDTNSNGVPDICEVDPCPADINGNGVVNGVDLAAVLCAWGTDGESEGGADVNSDGIVNGQDLAFVLSAWGPCITVPTWATLIEFAPDPAIVTNPTLRAAISATGLPWRVRDTATQIELVLIPPGTFEMGCSPSLLFGCDGDELPVHAVTLTQAFYMGRYEVTQAQWLSRTGSNPSAFQGFPDSSDRPVESVTWTASSAFASAYGMRLPTEAEWEYAYRAGTTTAFYGFPGAESGTNDDSAVTAIGWMAPNAGGQTHPVGLKLGNGFGLHDMSGNVQEWTSDWYSYNYYSSSPSVDPTGPESGFQLVVRGGCWDFNSSKGRSSDRSEECCSTPNDAFFYTGFRVARNP